MSDLTKMKVNLHHLEDQERNQLLEYVQWSLLEYMVLSNQNLQLDPILLHLRLIARLQQWGLPNYGNCIHVINEVKQKAKVRNLSATALFLLIQMHIFPTEHRELVQHIQQFFNMLIENDIWEYEIGPPFSIDDKSLPDEKKLWANGGAVMDDIRLHIIVADANAHDKERAAQEQGLSPDNQARVKIKFTAGKFYIYNSQTSSVNTNANSFR